MDMEDPLDPTDLDARRREDEFERAQEEADLKWLIGNPPGRRIMRRFLSKAGVWRTSFQADAALTAFREGERNMGLWFLDQVARYAPERMAELLNEAHDDDE